MQARPRLRSFLLACFLPVAFSASAAWAQTPPPPQSRPDPQGLAVLLSPDPVGLSPVLAKVLAGDGRFHLAPGNGIKLSLKGTELQLDPPLTLQARDQLRGKTPGQYLLVGRSLSQAEGGPGLSARVLDLSLGEVGPLFEATGSSVAEVSQRVRRFMRANHPLSGRVRDLRDGQVYIDLGTRAGLARGSGILIRRIVGIRQDTIALARVQRAEEWFSLCDIEERTSGQMPRVGDLVLEDVTGTLSRP